MADSKLSALTELAAAPAVDDELYIRDISEAAAAESKRITVANLMLSKHPASSTDNAIARYDSTLGAIQNSAVTVSDVSGSSVTVATTAGNSLVVETTEPAATTGASVAGTTAAFRAGDAVASTDTAGAAAGGDVTITAGAAARNTSGNANGGNINLVTGAGIGTGVAGSVLVPQGSLTALGLAFTGDADTGIYRSGANNLTFVAAATAVMTVAQGQVSGNSSASLLSGFKLSVTDRTTDAAETGTTGFGMITNAGGGALVTRTLPTAASGWTYTFYCENTNGIKIVAGASDVIRVIDKETAAAGYIQSTTKGSVVTLVAIDAVTWVATSIHGVWTDGTWTYDDSGLTTP